MARPKATTRKKTPVQTKTEIESQSQEVLITEEQVWDVLKFASNLYNGNVYTPQLLNQRLQDVGLSPQVATADAIDKALLDPKQNEDQLIGYSEFFELTNMLYKRVLYYLSGMLSFDLTYVPVGDVDFTDKKVYKDYKKDEKIVHDFLDKFDVKKEFGTVVRQLLRNETFFSVFRDDNEKYTLQELNHEYCIITGRFDYGFVFDFNMYLFMLPGIDIDMFPPIFKKMWKRVFGDNPIGKYNPSAPVDRRTGAYIMWTQTSPKDGFWAFKFNPELVSRIPFLTPMFADVVLQPVIRKLQTNSYIASAQKLLVGQIPLLSKDVKGSAVKDSVAVSPELLGKFLALLKAGLSDAVRVAAAPLDNMSGISFPLDAPFYEDYLKTTTATSGVNSRLIFTLDKNNAVESQLSINVDEYLMKYIYPHFADFLEYQINRRTKKYKFKFFLEGTNFFTDRKERFDNQTKMMEFGIVNHQKLAASLGMLPHDFLKQLAMTKAINFVDGFTPIAMGSQMSGDDISAKKAGRTSKPISELSESGVQTRDDASNSE